MLFNSPIRRSRTNSAVGAVVSESSPAFTTAQSLSSGSLDGGSVPLDDLLAGVEVAHRAFHHSGCEPGEVLVVVVVGVLSPVRAFGAARVVGAEDLLGEDPVGQGRISVEEQPRQEAGVEGGCLVVGG